MCFMHLIYYNYSTCCHNSNPPWAGIVAIQYVIESKSSHSYILGLVFKAELYFCIHVSVLLLIQIRFLKWCFQTYEQAAGKFLLNQFHVNPGLSQQTFEQLALSLCLVWRWYYSRMTRVWSCPSYYLCKLYLAQASGTGESIKPPPLAYKKWNFKGQENITDVVSCGKKID